MLRLKNYRLKLWLFIISSCLFLSTAITSCTYNTELVDLIKSKEEFVFTTDDLRGYTNWTVIGTKDRNADLGHFRTIYINKPEEANRASGTYPNGTIIIKESRDFNDRSNIVRFQIMAKRGSAYYNPEGNGWEWAILNGNQLTEDDLGLVDRGDNSLLLGGSTCYSCHTGQNDLVFGAY